MTSSTAPKTSRDLPGPGPLTDRDRETQEAVIEDAAETGDSGRDLVHGDGGTIEIPAKPGDLSKDD